MRIPAALLSIGFFVVLGCGKDEPANEGDGGADDGGPKLDADLDDAGASDAAQEITTDSATAVPRVDPAHVPQSFGAYDKAACGVLGETCTFASGSSCEGAICDLGVELCLPDLPAGQTSLKLCSPGGCGEDAPYCLSGRCLTLTEASCVCGAAGGSKLAVCAAPAISALGGRKEPSGEICLSRNARCGGSFTCCGGMSCTALATAGGQTFCQAECVADGQKCADNPCCSGDKARCLKLTGTPDFLCYPRCSEHSQCASGCCSNRADPEGGFCVEATRCTSNADGGSGGDAGSVSDASMSMCRIDGASCGAGTSCCTGLSCVTRPGVQGSTCMPRCNGPADCASGCCQLFSNSAGGYCAEALACMCIPQGTACGADGRSCCDGSRCAKFGADAGFSCAKTCQGSTDCGGNCCHALSGGANVCGLGPC